MTACLVAALAFVQNSDSGASGLDPDERVVLHPTAAALDERTQCWQVPIRFVVFEPEDGDPIRAAALEPLRACLCLDSGEQKERFERRARLFLVDHERREFVHVGVGDTSRRLGPTAADGCCETIVDVPVDVASRLARDGALPLTIGRAGDPDAASGRVWLVPPEGLSVVSDLDDTIKVTNVADRKAMLAATFLEEFEAVPGMADLYRRIAGSPDRSERDAKRPERRSVAFHYVSLSPWQLAPLIDEFLAENAFPGGSLHLQAFRLQDGDLGDLLGDSREKKLAAIEPLLARWPRRKFVLIGDSGQCDPEAYGELARRHPQQIERVWIRETTSRADARYDAAFTGVPRERWQLFADPAKLALPEGE